MKSLLEVYDSFKDVGDNGGGDKNTVHTYIDLYESYLKSIVDKPIKLLEIGIFKGHSMAMWTEYLPQGSTILGVDIIDRLEFETKGFHCLFGNVMNPLVINEISKVQWDVIIDDGSHLINEQVATFNSLIGFLKTDGLYFIEDIDKLDEVKPLFERAHFTVHDMRSHKNRFDDVLAVYKKK